MATLEDKILGEKLHNYCSSDEGSEDDEHSDSERAPKPSAALPEPGKWEGTSTNTGPKGVIKDWQRFKQLEIERQADGDRERAALVQKLSMTVRTALDEERRAVEDPDTAELLDDDFLLEYRRKRMEEMLRQTEHSKHFGSLVYLVNGQDYLDAIDKEHEAVKVMIHLYEHGIDACRRMNEAVGRLAGLYTNVKFCAMVSSKAGVSGDFKSRGLPALLVYKGGQIVGNFVRLADDLGSDFDTEDVQSFLVEHGMLEDKTLTPLLIRNGEDLDSD